MQLQRLRCYHRYLDLVSVQHAFTNGAHYVAGSGEGAQYRMEAPLMVLNGYMLFSDAQ